MVKSSKKKKYEILDEKNSSAESAVNDNEQKKIILKVHYFNFRKGKLFIIRVLRLCTFFFHSTISQERVTRFR